MKNRQRFAFFTRTNLSCNDLTGTKGFTSLASLLPGQLHPVHHAAMQHSQAFQLARQLL